MSGALLFVHAHPDDETLATGIALAHYARLGHDVHVLTCTLGEEGEVIPAELAHLASDRDDALGTWRREELRRAMAALGVGHRVLGEDPGRGALRYRDSGAGMPTAQDPRAFVRADIGEASRPRRRRDPRGGRVVVTYDEHGGYRHPDHVQTHRVTCAVVASLSGRATRPVCRGHAAVVGPRRPRVAGGERPGGLGWQVPGPMTRSHRPSSTMWQ